MRKRNTLVTQLSMARHIQAVLDRAQQTGLHHMQVSRKDSWGLVAACHLDKDCLSPEKDMEAQGLHHSSLGHTLGKVLVQQHQVWVQQA